MTTLKLDDEIRKFWEWFSASQCAILDAVRERTASWLSLNLAPRLRATQEDSPFPRLNWELGKGEHRKWSFIVSPTVKENIVLAERIIAGCPQSTEWEFHVGRQAKPNWDFQLSLPDESGRELRIDASEWHYIIKRTDAGAYVLFVANSLGAFSEQLKTKVAYLILDHSVGEMFVISKRTAAP